MIINDNQGEGNCLFCDNNEGIMPSISVYYYWRQPCFLGTFPGRLGILDAGFAIDDRIVAPLIGRGVNGLFGGILTAWESRLIVYVVVGVD